jgi:hypothetical protein
MKHIETLSIFACLLVVVSAVDTAAESPQPNIVFITADDMNFDSAGVYGCSVEDLTPNLHCLAREGMLFRYAYSTVTVCQPVRRTMHCGLYPHRSGSVGNGHPIGPEVVTLNERLHEAGYLISMMGKLPHNKQGLSTWVPMRAIRTRTSAYIWNAWSDGKKAYRAENMAGLTWNALVEAGKTDPKIQQRVDHYLYRTPEEFYSLKNDACERTNVIADPPCQERIDAMRAQLLAEMRRTGDPLADAFGRRGQPEALAAAMGRLESEYPNPNLVGKKAKPATGKSEPIPTKAGLITFQLPDELEAGKPALLRIRHWFPAELGRQTLTVTLKSEGRRLARHTVEAEGEGVADLTFTIPLDQAGKDVSFAAFVGTSFSKTPQMIQSRPQPVK